MASEPVWLSPKQVAGICGVSEEFLSHRRQQRRSPAFYRLGGKILYRHEEITAWLEANRHEPEKCLK